jgi:hypothetical protein
MRPFIVFTVLAILAWAPVSAQHVRQSVASDDRAVYVALVAPGAGAQRGRARAEPLDLRRAEGAHWIGVALARRAPGFDSLLVAKLHDAPRLGRGAGVALRARPSLLWRTADSDAARQRPAPSFSDGSMERVERDPQRIPLAFTVVQYSADRRWAVVFETMHCGPLCGADRYVALHRDDAGLWTVAAQVITVVS